MLYEKSPKSIERERRRGFRVTFFDFFWMASRETLTFETTFGRPWSETCFKSKRFVQGCPTKVNKNITRERRPEPKVTTLSAKITILEHARGLRGSSGFCGNGGSNCGADPPLTHVPGARMTVVTQTPSNKRGQRQGNQGRGQNQPQASITRPTS